MTNPWKREGLFYVVRLQTSVLTLKGNRRTLNVTKKLDFVSYHLIKWYHGEKKIIDMAHNMDGFYQ